MLVEGGSVSYSKSEGALNLQVTKKKGAELKHVLAKVNANLQKYQRDRSRSSQSIGSGHGNHLFSITYKEIDSIVSRKNGNAASTRWKVTMLNTWQWQCNERKIMKNKYYSAQRCWKFLRGDYYIWILLITYNKGFLACYSSVYSKERSAKLVPELIPFTVVRTAYYYHNTNTQ